MLRALFAALLLSLPLAARADRPALAELAQGIARQAAALAAPATTRLAIEVEAPAPRLASAAELALAQALREVGFAPPVAAKDEEDARRQGADALLSVRVGLRNGSAVAAGELRAVRENFFTGAALVAGGPLAATVAVDPALRLLASPAGPLRVEVARFARLDEAPLAVAVGSLGGTPVVAAITRDEIVLWDAGGGEVLRHPLRAGQAPMPARDPRAGLVIAGDRLRYALPLRGSAEVLRLVGGRLVTESTQPVDVLPLAAGGGHIYAAQLEAGGNLFAPALLVAKVGAPAAPRVVALPAPFVTALAGAGGTFAVIDGTGRLAAPGVPAGFTAGDAGAFADLDGDGAPELVATARTGAAPDRVRILPLDPAAVEPPALDLPELILAAAGGDLGGGAEAVILAGDRGTLYLLRRAP